MKTIVVGITGASGSIYGLRLIKELAARTLAVHVVASTAGQQVVAHETGRELTDWLANLPGVLREDNDNLFAPIASGSFGAEAMVVAPCSMATLGAIASGAGRGLLGRAADVMMKEGRPLVLLPRETPLSALHLENMAKLARLGVTILPAMPGFYHHPQTLDDLVNFIVGRVLDTLHIEHNLYTKWGTKE